MLYLEDISRHILYRTAYRARGLISARGEYILFIASQRML